MKWFPLAVVSELGSEYGFDVFRLGGEDTSTAGRGSFNSVAMSCGKSEEAVPDFEVLVVDCAADGTDDEVDIWDEMS